MVAVDRSFSMRDGEGTSTRLDEAKDEAIDILSETQAGDRRKWSRWAARCRP